MKRPVIVAATAVVTILIMYACSSTIPTGKTSFVTIAIGGDGQKATLHAEKATTWRKLRYYLADAKLMPEAYAYIPSVVQVLVVTVSAPDITTPIVGIDSLKPDQTTSTVRIEVPNGTSRQFTVEGIRGIDSRTYYRGMATADLSGADVDLPISMDFVGPGLFVNIASGSDTPATTGTSTNPFRTIAYALTRTSGTDAIIVSAGSYTPAGLASPAPYQLKLGNALICAGINLSTVIDYSTVSSVAAIKGAEGASIDNCLIRMSQFGFNITGIDDREGTTVLNKGIRINNVEVVMPYNSTFGTIVGIDLYSDSPVIESTVTATGSFVTNQMVGIQVNSGKPSIQASTVRGLNTGISLASGAGDAIISGATITGNQTGILIATTNKPTLTSSQITNNGTGLQITAGNPSVSLNIIQNNTGSGISISGAASGQITGNSIDHNNTGILISNTTGDPRVNGNSIYCNTFTGADVSAPIAIRLENNAWNRDANTSPPGPRVDIGNCLAGADICPRSAPDPIYVPFSTAVSNGCPTP